MSVFVSDVWQSPTPVPTTQLITKVARLYGLGNDDETKGLALEWLDEAVRDLNTHQYEFNLVVQTGIVLEDGTPDYQLASNFYKEKTAYLVNPTSNEKFDPLRYIDWATFNRLYIPVDTVKEQPRAYSARNTHDTGKIFLGPTPDPSTAADMTLTVEYYRRISLPSNTPQIDLPQEIENAILYEAYKRAVLYFEGPTGDWKSYAMLATDIISRLKSIDRRHPDETTRFRLYDRYRGSTPLGSKKASVLTIKL